MIITSTIGSTMNPLANYLKRDKAPTLLTL
jgi:hypothetical protein